MTDVEVTAEPIEDVPIPNYITFNTTAPEPQPQPETSSQPEMPSAYQSIIDQQNAQIAALMEHNANLNNQIAQMVQNGVQFNQTQGQAQALQVGQNWAVQPGNVPSLSDGEDWSMEALGREIGRK